MTINYSNNSNNNVIIKVTLTVRWNPKSWWLNTKDVHFLFIKIQWWCEGRDWWAEDLSSAAIQGPGWWILYCLQQVVTLQQEHFMRQACIKHYITSTHILLARTYAHGFLQIQGRSEVWSPWLGRTFEQSLSLWNSCTNLWWTASHFCHKQLQQQ